MRPTALLYHTNRYVRFGVIPRTGLLDGGHTVLTESDYLKSADNPGARSSWPARSSTRRTVDAPPARCRATVGQPAGGPKSRGRRSWESRTTIRCSASGGPYLCLILEKHCLIGRLAETTAARLVPPAPAWEAMMFKPFDRQVKWALKDRYAIEGARGSGGMATVYLAREKRLPRQVAIKVLKPQGASRVARQRFLREVEFASQLTHPHIVPIFRDRGEVDGLPYYVMPHITGPTVRDRLREEGAPAAGRCPADHHRDR